MEIEVGGAVFALEAEDLEIQEEAREGLVVQGDGSFTAALDPTLDEDLRREGLARELVNRVQRLRKDSGLDITDRISLGVLGTGEVTAAAGEFETFITGETLAREFFIGAPEEGHEFEFSVDASSTGTRPGSVFPALPIEGPKEQKPRSSTSRGDRPREFREAKRFASWWKRARKSAWIGFWPGAWGFPVLVAWD